MTDARTFEVLGLDASKVQSLRDAPIAAGVTMGVVLVADDARIATVLKFVDGRLADVALAGPEARSGALMIAGPAAVLRRLVRGETTLSAEINWLHIEGDIAALMSAVPVLQGAVPREVLRTAASTSDTWARVNAALAAHPEVQGFQLVAWHRSVGPLIDWAAGSTFGPRPMASDTLHHVRCATKPLLALAAVRMHLDGRLDLSVDLGDIAGFALPRSYATGWDALCHDAGLASPRLLELWMCDPARRTDLIRAAPVLSPHEQYSEVTAAAIIDHLVCNSGGSPQTDVVEPLGLEDEVVLVPRLDVTSRIGCAFVVDPHRGATVPLVVDLTPQVAETVGPVMGGLASARGLGRFYASLIDERGDNRVARIRTAAVTALAYRRGPADDPILRRRQVDFAAGFMVDLAAHGYGKSVGARAFGHTGWMGSSWGFADPEAGLACGFIHNGWVSAQVNDEIRAEIITAVYDLIEAC